jgi:hypothetical protein
LSSEKIKYILLDLHAKDDDGIAIIKINRLLLIAVSNINLTIGLSIDLDLLYRIFIHIEISSINGTKRWYIDVGDPIATTTTTTPVVLIHGLPFNHQMWNPHSL